MLQPNKSAIDRKWKKSQAIAGSLNLSVNALGQRAKNIIDAKMIAANLGTQIPGIDQWLDGVKNLQTRQVRIARIVADVMTGNLGLYHSDQVPGDIDVVAPPGTSDDELAQYQFGWVLIAVGVVVVVGLVAFLWNEHTEAEKSRNYYRPLFDACDQKLSGDPDWEAKKSSREWALRKTTWERMEDGAKKILGGVKIGFALAIPLAALVLMSWLKPKNR